MIQQNPRFADSAMQDPRMITVLGVLLGIDMQGFSRPEGSDEMPEGLSPLNPTGTQSSHHPPPEPTRPSPPNQSAQAASTQMAEEEVEEDADTKIKQAAESEKKLGGEAYKRRDFEEAERAYSKAWELWPKDITYLTNLSGQFSQHHVCNVAHATLSGVL
jgi:stress-induced-phosphoprotein 1